MLDLPEELWAKHILKHAGASELVRLQRVCRALHPLASHASYQPVIHAERERRASARQADRDRRRRDYLYNRQPAIVKAALECKMDSVVALLDSGVAVDECATWVETEEKYGGYDKSWTWKMDTALSIACSQGHLPMVQLLLARGANPEHRVCIQADVHYTPAAIARQNGHSLCADYMDRVIDALEAPRRAEHQQRAREASIKLREEARRLRTAGPPYPASAGGIYPQTFASAAFDFLHGLGWEKYPPARYKSTQAFGSGEEVDRAESASFAILALEVLKTQPQFLPSCYNTQESVCKEMLEHLRAMPEAAGALEALSAFEQHTQAEAERQRLAIQRRREQEEEQAELRRQRRNLEIARCQRARPGRWWVGHCTDNRCTEFDACTYGHEGHDLPPACRWGVHCTTGESCFYNHLGDGRFNCTPLLAARHGAAQSLAAPGSTAVATRAAAPVMAMATTWAEWTDQYAHVDESAREE